MGHVRILDQQDDLEAWAEAVSACPSGFAESQAPFGVTGGHDRSTIWSGKPGRLAWPLSIVIIIALSGGLWAAIILAARALIELVR